MRHCKTSIKWKGDSTALLTWTTDMRCWSFSIPAGHSCPLAIYGPGNICEYCYAMMNRYNGPNVLRAQWIRYQWALHVQPVTFIRTLAGAIKKENIKYFRGHDSGDFFNKGYLRRWIEVCRLCPDIKFWFPTRNWKKPKTWASVLKILAALPNVKVRPSAIGLNDPPPITDLSGGSTVVTIPEYAAELGCKMCPKSINKSNCEAQMCRDCWDSDVPIAYLIHTYSGQNKAYPVTQHIKDYRNEFKKQA